MLLTPFQIDAVLAQIHPDGPGQQPNSDIADVPTVQWPTTIYFALDVRLSEKPGVKDEILKALDWWSKDTCLEFVELTSSRDKHIQDFLLFAEKGG